MGGADQRPLASHLVEASEEELSEASGLLDLAEDGLDGVFSQAIARAEAGAFELLGYGGHQGFGLELPVAAGMALAVLAAPGRQVGGDPALDHALEVGLRGKAAIAGDLPRLAPEIGLGLVDQRQQGRVVGGIGDQTLGEDDLVGVIDRDLAVVAGNEAVAGGQDAAVGVGEVALGLVG